MTETEFENVVDTMLEKIAESIDSMEMDIDCELASGILTLTYEDDSKMVINRQTPMREIWVAARSGGFHYRLDDGLWKETRSSYTLSQRLNELVGQQLRRAVSLDLGA
ncbi:MAG: iron donor protein CyaY [Proteobacteria bacterium]|nr:iron donor protein CyaY [Pseudomonadota bacterium]MDE3207727.1 iron donor protein CyaY [Pseudomonadota bacterium]